MTGARLNRVSYFIAVLLAAMLVMALPGCGGGGTHTTWEVNAALHQQSPATGVTQYAPVTYVVDASQSAEVEKAADAITAYDWDLNNDGVFEITSGTVTQNVVCTQPLANATQHYNVSVLVHSDKASPSTDEVSLAWDVARPVDLTAAPQSGTQTMDVVLTATEHHGGTPAVATIVWDFDDGTAPETVTISGGATTAADWTRTHTFQATPGGTVTYNPKVQVKYTGYDAFTYEDSRTITISTPPDPPVAVLHASNRIGHQKPWTVNFDATDSSDPDGNIIDYEWDIDGDNVFNETADAIFGAAENTARGDNSPSVVYPEWGVFWTQVRVTATDMQTDTSQVLVGDVPMPVVINEPPTAVLINLTANQGAPGLDVTFDASDSYDPTPGGSIVKYEWDWIGDGVTWEVGTAVMTHKFTTAGIFHPTVRVTDSNGGTAAKSVIITINTNPTASLLTLPSPANGKYPLKVEFDASGSSDPESAIASYEWDYDGDGVFSETGAELGSLNDNTPSFTYDQSYVAQSPFDVTVKVIDNYGAEDIASIQVSVEGWAPTAGAVITYDPLNPDFDVTTVAPGADDDLLVTVDPSSSHDNDPAPGLKGITQYIYEWGDDLDDDGLDNDSDIETFDTPAVRTHIYAYPTGANSHILDDPLYGFRLTVIDRDTLSNTTTGSVPVSASMEGLHFWRRAIVNTGGTKYFGLWSSMKAVDGIPAVAYYDSTNRRLLYQRATKAVPVSDADWNVPAQVVDDGMHFADTTKHDVGSYCCMVMTGDDDYPAIAYYDATARQLCYTRSVDPLGAVWPGNPKILDTGNIGTVKGFVALAEINFNPAICYITDDEQDRLMYIRATEPTGLMPWSDPVEVAVATGKNAFEYCTLASIKAAPAIVYRDVDNLNLMYNRALDSDGLTWGAGAYVEHNTIGVVQDCKLIDVDLDGSGVRMPVVVYHNFIDDLRRNVLYLMAEDEYGASWNHDEDVVVVGSGRYPDVMQTEPGGDIWVSFYEYTPHPIGRLRVARIDSTYFDTDTWGRTQVGVESLKVPDPFTDRGLYSSLLPVEIDGDKYPAVVYYDKSNGDLRYALYH